MQLQRDYKRIVIKIGASIITKEGSHINQPALESLVADISKLQEKKKEIILVSSGAIACGMMSLGLKVRPTRLSQLQSVAAIGQNILMRLYSNLFKRKKRLCAQVLLTWDDFDKRNRYLNAKNTLLDLIKMGVVPVVNENDTVSVEEIRFGDNDKLSALVASLVSADLLIILSDVEGLYKDKRCNLIPIVEDITKEVESLACGTDKASCVGGMSTKIEAARIATNSGIPCIIANGHQRGTLLKIANNESVGTIFLPRIKSGSARKQWISQSTKPKGSIFVDDGAKEALVKAKRSLLAVGVINIDGDFNNGDAVLVVDKFGKAFAKGLVNLSSQDLKISKGKHIQGEVIHRNNLILL